MMNDKGIGIQSNFGFLALKVNTQDEQVIRTARNEYKS